MKLATEVRQLLENRDHLKKMFKVDDSAFEKATEKHNHASIIKTKEGYAGFSHRAVAEFKIGDKLFDQNYGSDMEEAELDKMKFQDRGEKTIKTMEQCREAACNFADYVS